MTPKVKIGAGMDAFQFFESKRKFEFNIGGGIGVVG